LGTGIPLAVGDVFTAGDYKVTITEITSGSQTGYNGKGYVEQMKLIGLTAGGVPLVKRVAVTLENTVVNDCYELAGGKVISEYDPNWGGILDVDELISDVKEIAKLFGKLLPKSIDWVNMDGFGEDYTELGDDLLNELKDVRSKVSSNPDLDGNLKSKMLLKYDDAISKFQNLLSQLKQQPNANGRIINSNDLSNQKLQTIQSLALAESSIWEAFKEYITSLNGCSLSDYLHQEGIVPQCLWAQSPIIPTIIDLPLSSGVIDGLWDNTIGGVFGIFKMLEVSQCFSQPSDFSVTQGGEVHWNNNKDHKYYSEECGKLRDEFGGFGNLIISGITKPFEGNIIENFWNYLSCNPIIPNVNAENCIHYRFGKTVIDGIFIVADGIGLVKGGISLIKKGASKLPDLSFKLKTNAGKIQRTISTTIRETSVNVAGKVRKLMGHYIEGKVVCVQTEQGLAFTKFAPNNNSSGQVVATMENVDILYEGDYYAKADVQVHRDPANPNDFESTIHPPCTFGTSGMINLNNANLRSSSNQEAIKFENNIFKYSNEVKNISYANSNFTNSELNFQYFVTNTLNTPCVPEYTLKGATETGATRRKQIVDRPRQELDGSIVHLRANAIYHVDDYTYHTDDLGRVKKVEAELRTGTRNRESDYQKQIKFQDPHTSTTHPNDPDDGGHLIGNQFDGPNEAINIVPQRASLNRSGPDGAWYRMEMRWAELIGKGEKVKVEIIIKYDGNSRRPNKFEVFQTIGSGRKEGVLSANN
jgi:hypothetical protein